MTRDDRFEVYFGDDIPCHILICVCLYLYVCMYVCMYVFESAFLSATSCALEK
jgi:hypothetical protein